MHLCKKFTPLHNRGAMLPRGRHDYSKLLFCGHPGYVLAKRLRLQVRLVDTGLQRAGVAAVGAKWHIGVEGNISFAGELLTRCIISLTRDRKIRMSVAVF